MKTIALILAGGSGMRLWPLSRQKLPKQLLPLIGERTLLQETCRRLFPLIHPQDQWIITGKSYYTQVIEMVTSLRNQFPDETGEHKYIEVLKEPMAKNTAPAIFWAARRCQQMYGEDTVLMVLPSDHLITMENEFLETIHKGIAKAGEGYLVTFGIKPTHPETGYGYIKVDANQALSNEPYLVADFVEKPDQIKAQEYVKSDKYLWNSGMFAFHIGALIEESRKLCPEIFEPFLLCDPFKPDSVEIAYNQVKPQSIDFAVMEQTDQAFVIPASFGWSDVGSWQSVFELSPKDLEGNVFYGEQIIIDSKDCLIYGGHRLIAVVGMEAVAIIDTADALLISPLNETQRVKEIVEELQRRGSGCI
ncbi:MAG: mannose-1-phosphate guanylyltransferase [Syntrophomonas sp.]|nr:mannose-1-phosphate guanylyltransferase [Syntrophomonas sp.]